MAAMETLPKSERPKKQREEEAPPPGTWGALEWPGDQKMLEQPLQPGRRLFGLQGIWKESG